MLPGVVRSNPRSFIVAAFVVSAGLAGGAAVAFVNAGDGDGTVTSDGPVVTASPTPSETPSPTATPEPTATATATATPSATATATATATPTATSGSRTYAYPRPSRTYDGLVLTVTINPGGGNDQTNFELTAKGKDGDGEVYFDGLTWGDGKSIGSVGSPQKCKSWPPLHSPPGPYEPEPDSATYIYHHQYVTPGTYVIKVRMSSMSKDCKPHGPRTEVRNVEVTVKVVSATPSPSPTAT
jgi:hypothetical protein